MNQIISQQQKRIYIEKKDGGIQNAILRVSCLVKLHDEGRNSVYQIAARKEIIYPEAEGHHARHGRLLSIYPALINRTHLKTRILNTRIG